MGLFDRILSRLGRRRAEPKRDTAPFPRLTSLGLQLRGRDRPLIKPTPSNLRRFGRTVYARRAIKAIKDPIANLGWEIAPKPDVKLNSEIKRQIEITTNCFAKPNHDDSFSTMVEQLAEDMCHGGAGALEHQVGADPARPLWMWPVDALSIQLFADWDGTQSGARYFQSLGFGNIGGQSGVSLRNDELIYIRLDPSTENPFGLGPLEVAFLTIGRLLGLSEYAGNVVGNATKETLLFFENAPDTWINAFREYWRNEIEGQGQTPIVGAPGKATAVKMRGGDDTALFPKGHEILVREIATAFCLSPQNLSIERDVNRDTAEVSEDRDWRLTIIPFAQRIAYHLNREAIEQKLGFSQIMFKWLGLDRDDELASAHIFELRYKNNATVPNEERARLGQPPLKNRWADMTYADMQIAIKAAQGAKEVDDPELTDNQGAEQDRADREEPPREPEKRKTKGR